MHDEIEIIDTLRSGDVARAIAMARATIEARPDDPQALRVLAIALSMAGQPGEAHQALDRAIALAPQDSSLYYQRAALLVSENRSGDAQPALERSVELNPNELRSYVMQAQLALGQGNLDEADRLARLAARINPDHPWLMTIQGLVLLHRNQLPEAHKLIARGAQLAPDDIQTRYALALSFLAQGHLAFAEQAFRRVVAKNPKAVGIRHMLADVIRRQERPAEAAEVIEEGLALDENFPPDVLRYAGELWLVANQHERALPLLRRAVAGMPDDRVAMDALIEALRRKGDKAQARDAVEDMLKASPHVDGLWSARLSFEPEGGDVAGIAARWREAVPESVHPLHVQMWQAIQDGDRAASRALAEQIIEREPGHVAAQSEIIEQLFNSDPAAAVAHIQGLLPQIPDPENRRMVLAWLGRAQDRAGQYADAVDTWAQVQAITGPKAVPLPPASGDARTWPPVVEVEVAGSRPVFLYGPPGSGAERLVSTFLHNFGKRMAVDRNSDQPPQDPLQFPQTATRLASGELDAAMVVAGWRGVLPQRGLASDAAPIDWLSWWDNALVPVLREGLPDALLLLVLCDPREMLLDWLQRDSFVRHEAGTPAQMAAWLATVLDQIAALVEGNYVAHRVVRLDGIADDAAAIASAVGASLDVPVSPAPALGPGRFPAGRWREYREALAEPFATLAPVARRLGYPDN
ncbi:MAG TPA: tetratricopeptide repeat protein [Luteimonas sp.]|nr:tetratricopeptide repeat protein [Luteimonas sp.]